MSLALQIACGGARESGGLILKSKFGSDFKREEKDACKQIEKLKIES